MTVFVFGMAKTEREEKSVNFVDLTNCFSKIIISKSVSGFLTKFLSNVLVVLMIKPLRKSMMILDVNFSHNFENNESCNFYLILPVIINNS